MEFKCGNCGYTDYGTVIHRDRVSLICLKCGKVARIESDNPLQEFRCCECGCEECEGYENELGMYTKCKNCGDVCQTYEPLPCVPKCPTCGSTNIRRIGVGKKMLGLMSFGIMSKSMQSQFECANCKYKW